MPKKTKRKTFKSIEEFDRFFFPELSNKQAENDDQEDPTTTAEEITDNVLSSIK